MKPSFFIVGAPRCGTTAMYEYLNSHPALFLPTLKEPHYFADDLSGYRFVSSHEEYCSLFSSVDKQAALAGEASVLYLLSSVAVPNILNYEPNAKFIVHVRNPIDMYESVHGMLYNVFYEDEPDCARAWHLQAERAAGRNVPALCHEPALLQYGLLCGLGTQLERLMAVAAPEQVKIVVFDDLVSSPRLVYEDVLRFLGVSSDGKTEFPRINERRSHRSTWLARTMQSPPGRLNRMRARLKYEYYVKRSWIGKLAYSAARAVKSRNSTTRRATQMPAAFRAWLAERFRPEVERLEGILCRNLDHWCDPPTRRESASAA